MAAVAVAGGRAAAKTDRVSRRPGGTDIQLRVTVALPAYLTPRNAWRRAIHRAAAAEFAAANLRFSEQDRIGIVVELEMTEGMLRFHDVDNRLKDVLDALQGRVGGSKRVRALPALIPNDKQIFKAAVEKRLARDGFSGGGRLQVWRLDGD